MILEILIDMDARVNNKLSLCIVQGKYSDKYKLLIF